MSLIEKKNLNLIFGRRSIRVYGPGVVSRHEVQLMLEAAMAAPSACAADPWRFVVLSSPESRRRVAEVLPHGKMMASAGAGFVICGDLKAAHDHRLSYLLQDCAAATENLLLAAHALGLGACWLGVHPRKERIEKIRKLCGLPKTVIPAACVAVGHPGETKEARTRFNPEFVHFEKW